MKTVIFGGAGFIGSHLTRSLSQAGAEVTVADIVKPADLPDKVEYVECDVREPIVIDHADPFDVVYNLAAVHRTPGHEPSEYYETNVTGAQQIVDWSADNDAKSICFTSSIAIYGPSENAKTETSTPKPNSDYGRSKLLAEQIHRRWLKGGDDRRLVVARPAVIFGFGEQGNFTRLAGALQRRRFMYAGRTDVIKSCGYVEDLVAAFDFVLESGDRDVTFNFCYEDRYTIEQICQAFHDVAGYALPRNLPKPLLSAVMSGLKLVNPHDRGSLSSARIAKLTASTNIVPGELTARSFTWPTDIEAGLRSWRESSPTSEFV